METGKQYPVYTFEAKNDTIDGKYFVAANDEYCAKRYVFLINHTISPIRIDIESCTKFKNLKYICPHQNKEVNAICIINALHHKC